MMEQFTMECGTTDFQKDLEFVSTLMEVNLTATGWTGNLMELALKLWQTALFMKETGWKAKLEAWAANSYQTKLFSMDSGRTPSS